MYQVTEVSQDVVGTHRTVVFSIVVVGALTRCKLLHSVCNLKAAQKNVPCGLIWELMLYLFKQGHNASEAAKNVRCSKGEDAVDLQYS